MTQSELKELLDHEAARINSPEFISDDPVQFPRRFEELRDIEIAAMLCSAIAWGNRKMICRDCDRMLALMENRPFRYLMLGDWEELPDDLNIHRTFFARNLKNFLRGLKQIYQKYGSLENFARSSHVDQDESPSWKLVQHINEYISDPRCLPQNLKTTALKRVNMALRWLCRQDGIVDIGCWSLIPPSKLFIPLDVHVIATARELGLLTRKSPDRKAVIEITNRLRSFRPEDPTFYDYALFGLGMSL